MLYSDIWAAVAHELRGDVGGLRAGALLCRATRRTMQRELFHTVRVTDDLGDRWHALLAESAHLAAHVRRIVVHIRDGTCRRAFFQRCADAGLHGVRELRLAHIYWQLQDDPLLAIIAGAFPALRVLEALDSGFFSGRSLLYMLSAFTRLRILRLDRCALNDPHGAEDILTAPMHLKELWWSPLASPNGLTRLVTIPIPWAEVQTLGIRTDHAAMIWPELSRTQATLQHLAIPSMVHTEVLEQQLTAFGYRGSRFLARLKTLVFQIFLSSFPTESCLNTMAAILDSIPSPLLQRVTIVIRTPRLHWTTGICWSVISDGLMRLHRQVSPALRKQVCILVLAPRVDQECSAVQTIRDSFHEVQACGDLEVIIPCDGEVQQVAVSHFPMLLADLQDKRK